MVIRPIEKLVKMIDNRQKLTLNRQEKRHYYQKFKKITDGGTFNKNCAPCWEKPLRVILKHEHPPKPQLQKHKMIKHDIKDYHIGGGYYQLPKGERVRGKKKALEILNKNK